ncbi:hypothetical protein ACFOU0_04745 [Salinicoccus sesuvii]|uniref:AAA+ ATPase domain-containing protein n=1 Tax=Salinicoccus sesuvii TaxID=868281 RepID=A0ABV7N6T8_9STAP
MVDIKDLDRKLLFLVGPNGSGKTHALKQSMENVDEKCILITEDGNPLFVKKINKVIIDYEKALYSYTEEEQRGRGDRLLEEDEISVNSLNIIDFCYKKFKKLNQVINKSMGQEKLNNLLKILLSYNLNNIKLFYFDEPENFLDEEYLKEVANLIRLLIENEKVVRVVTHNSRLLRLLNVNLENIIVLKQYKQLSISSLKIKECYEEVRENIGTIVRNINAEESAQINYRLSFIDNDTLFESFLNQYLKDEQFYRTLFYKEILIVEGQSDIIALNHIKDSFDVSLEVFNPNGKTFIPFFVLLFNILGKNIRVVIDDDLENPTGARLKHPVALTQYLKQLSEELDFHLILHSPDLEGHYSMDLDSMARKFGMSNTIRNREKGMFKSLSSFDFFSQNENAERLKKHIFAIKDSSFELS